MGFQRLGSTTQDHEWKELQGDRLDCCGPAVMNPKVAAMGKQKEEHKNTWKNLLLQSSHELQTGGEWGLTVKTQHECLGKQGEMTE